MKPCGHPVRDADRGYRLLFHRARIENGKIGAAVVHIDNKADQPTIVLCGIRVARHEDEFAQKAVSPELMLLARTGF